MCTEKAYLATMHEFFDIQTQELNLCTSETVIMVTEIYNSLLLSTSPTVEKHEAEIFFFLRRNTIDKKKLHSYNRHTDHTDIAQPTEY